MGQPAISASGLSKRYVLGEHVRYKTFRESLTGAFRRLVGAAPRAARQTIWALKDVAFEVEPGETLGIIGRNGAGKSTVLKILARITEPTEGRAEIRGRVGSLLEVGTGFHPELTGRENVFLNGAILGMRRSEIQAKFDRIVEFAEIEAFLDTPVKRYSSGMHVRLAFAVAAHLEPEILMIDEVLAVGDAAFQKKCLGLMDEVSRQGRTVLFVSHDLAAIQQLTRSGLLLEGGRVAAYGPTGEVVQRYLSSLQERATNVYAGDDLRRPFPELSRAVEFERLELEGFPTALVPAEHDPAFLLTVHGNGDVERFRFSVTIFRADGIAVGNVFGEESLSLRAGDTVTFRLQLADLRLAPGMYHCALAAGQGDHLSERREFDVVRDVLHFQVLSDGEQAGIAGEWHPAWGSVRFPVPEVTRVD